MDARGKREGVCTYGKDSDNDSRCHGEQNAGLCTQHLLVTCQAIPAAASGCEPFFFFRDLITGAGKGKVEAWYP